MVAASIALQQPCIQNPIPPNPFAGPGILGCDPKRMAEEAAGQAKDAAKQAKEIRIIMKQRRGDAEHERMWGVEMGRLGEEMGHLGEAMGEQVRVFSDDEELPGFKEGEAPRAESTPRIRVMRIHGKDAGGPPKTEIELLQKEIEHLQKRLEQLRKNEGSPRSVPRPPMPPEPPMPLDHSVPPPPPAPPAAPLPPQPPSGGAD